MCSSDLGLFVERLDDLHCHDRLQLADIGIRDIKVQIDISASAEALCGLRNRGEFVPP